MPSYKRIYIHSNSLYLSHILWSLRLVLVVETDKNAQALTHTHTHIPGDRANQFIRPLRQRTVYVELCTADRKTICLWLRFWPYGRVAVAHVCCLSDCRN